jgi:osmoprotectant transport system permease protein
VELTIDWSWLGDHVGAMVNALTQHLTLVIIPVVLGFAISLVIGIWAHRHPRYYPFLTTVAGILYTVPSLAAFAILIVITGFSIVTVVIPLTTYTLLILIRTTFNGLQSVPAEVIEAAEGMGYTGGQRLLRVELPMAVPMLMAGLRLATVTTIGLATVAAILGDSFGGFGFFITEGLSRFFATEIYLGAVLSILLAFAADFLLVRVEHVITPWARARARIGP